jgi:hypothetical protein
MPPQPSSPVRRPRPSRRQRQRQNRGASPSRHLRRRSTSRTVTQRVLLVRLPCTAATPDTAVTSTDTTTASGASDGHEVATCTALTRRRAVEVASSRASHVPNVVASDRFAPMCQRAMRRGSARYRRWSTSAEQLRVGGVPRFRSRSFGSVRGAQPLATPLQVPWLLPKLLVSSA